MIKKIKLWKVKVLKEEEVTREFSGLENYGCSLSNITNGTVIFSNPKKGLIIKAKDGAIKVLEIQGENAKKMSINDFLRGNNITIGTILQ